MLENSEYIINNILKAMTDKGYSKSDEIRQRTSCGEKSTIDDRGMALNGG